MRTTIAIGILAIFGFGCSGEVDIPKFCFLQTDVAVPVDPEFQARIDQLEQNNPMFNLVDEIRNQESVTTFTQDLSSPIQSMEDLGAKAKLNLQFVDVIVTKGLTSFEDVGNISLEAEPAQPGTGLSRIVVAVCEPSAGCDNTGSTLRMTGSGQDIVPYLSAGELLFTLKLTGGDPTQEMVFEVDTCLTGGADYEQTFL